MSEPAPIGHNFLRWRNPVLWGIGLTLILIGGFVWVFSLEDCGQASCETKWHKLIASSPNEIGDTLAGLAGSLAFLWIIVTVMLQSQELREQRKEMEEQRIAAQEMAKAMTAQAAIFEKEQKQREELQAKEVLEQRLTGLANAIDFEARHIQLWGNSWAGIGSVFEERQEQPLDEYLSKSSSMFDFFYTTNQGLFDSNPSQKFTGSISFYTEILKHIKLVESVTPQLGKDQIVRLDTIKLEKLKIYLDAFINEDQWADEAHMPQEGAPE